MNINIRIDLTPGTARRVAYVGLTLLLVGVAAVAYAVPVTFVGHQKLTADQLNQNFGDLEARVTALNAALDSKADKSQLRVVTDWQTYTPTISTEKGGVVSGHTTTGYYRRVGDSIEVRTVTFFKAAPDSGALWWQWSLPVGLTIDFARVGEVGDATVGGGLAQQGTNQNFMVGVYARSPIGVSAVANGAPSLYMNDHNPVLFDSGGNVNLYFTVPIVGWGATP